MHEQIYILFLCQKKYHRQRNVQYVILIHGDVTYVWGQLGPSEVQLLVRLLVNRNPSRHFGRGSAAQKLLPTPQIQRL